MPLTRESSACGRTVSPTTLSKHIHYRRRVVWRDGVQILRTKWCCIRTIYSWTGRKRRTLSFRVDQKAKGTMSLLNERPVVSVPALRPVVKHTAALTKRQSMQISKREGRNKRSVSRCPLVRSPFCCRLMVWWWCRTTYQSQTINHVFCDDDGVAVCFYTGLPPLSFGVVWMKPWVSLYALRFWFIRVWTLKWQILT